MARSPLKKSFGLRAAQIRQLGVAESMTYRRDMPSIRLLDLTNLVMALASKHFFNGLLRLGAMPDWTHLTLRLTHCPACNYDIAALARRSRCPECGFAYDEKMFVLEGWRLPGSRAWLRAAIVYGPIGVILLGVLRYEFGLSARIIQGMVVGAVAVMALAYLLAWRRDKSGGRVLRRFLITDDGVARLGRRAVYMWRNYSHVMLMPAGDRWRIHLYPSWWRAVGPPAVNAVLECEEREAEAVRDEIQRRINAARRAESEERPPRALPRRWW